MYQLIKSRINKFHQNATEATFIIPMNSWQISEMWTTRLQPWIRILIRDPLAIPRRADDRVRVHVKVKTVCPKIIRSVSDFKVKPDRQTRGNRNGSVFAGHLEIAMHCCDPFADSFVPRWLIASGKLGAPCPSPEFMEVGLVVWKREQNFSYKILRTKYIENIYVLSICTFLIILYWLKLTHYC